MSPEIDGTLGRTAPGDPVQAERMMAGCPTRPIVRLRCGLRAAAFSWAVFGLLLAGLLTGWLGAGAALAGDASTGAFLRIETGGHTARVNRLATDGQGRLIASVSNDKTLRLWSRDSGEPLGVLRVPMEAGDEGALYAVALSADGSLAVAAGNTGTSWGDGVTLYLFDVKAQRLKARLPGQPQVLNDLAISPDGRFVAGAFGGTAGIRVWDSTSFRLVAEDTGYEARVSALAFAPDGRLATASFDGNVRLYDAGFKQKTKRNPGKGLPYSVAFSHDGSLLAVGYADQTRVDVLSGTDLKTRYSPKTTGIAGGSFAAVAWDGATLVAAGTATQDGTRNVVRRWAEAGKGAFTDVAAARDSVTYLLALPGGGVAFAAADPGWGVIDPAGRLQFARMGDVADYRDIHLGRFGLSDDGLVLEFGMEQGGQRPMRFDVLARSLTPAPDPLPGLNRPTVEGPGIGVADWRNSRAPKVNGQPVKLDSGEWARSVTVLGPQRRVLLGGEFSLRLLDSAGAELARAEVPAAVWGVVASADGRVAVAALGDGTLRWYALSGGARPLEELAALFPHRDGRRWVLWTPEAFFDHSESGGETLVGFHLNDPKKKGSQWIEFKQVYRVFDAPELVRAKLQQTGQADIAARLAAIGDIRLLTQRRPQVTLLDYCTVPAASRGLALGTGASEAPASAGSPAPPPAAPTTPAAAADAETCHPLDMTPVSRAFARAKEPAPSPAAPPKPPKPSVQSGSPAGSQGVELDVAAEEPRLTVALPEGIGSVRLRYRLADTGGGIGTVDLFRNGRNVSGQDKSRAFARAKEPAPPQPAAQPSAAQSAAPQSSAASPKDQTPAPEERVSTVRLDPGSNRVQIRAYNGSDAIYERSALVDFVLPKPAPVADAAADDGKGQRVVADRPRLITFVVGIDKYRPEGSQLRFARADATAFADALRDRIPAGYDRDQSLALSKTLYDEEASREAVVAGLEALAANAREEDTVVLYLAGHGVIVPSPKDPSVKLYHFITQDVSAATAEAIGREGLSEKELNRLVSAISARNVLVMLDTCHSGAVSAGTVDKLYQDMGQRYLLAASSEQEEALDSYDGRNGIFAHAVLEGLKGKALLPGDEAVYNLTLGQYVNRAVPRLAREKRWHQSAIFKTGGNELNPFPLAAPEAGKP
ncbi:WD domain-containing protein, G-beta repeat-containing protein [Azospirillum oryzae]|uniref:WD domain-containing protein, G-beta repeat-containing protein n=1 Tax=Azospirillum oryzae TaxID=286727 RepID=A0A1X7FEP4_9PROT|nr:WD domain-containing protein, G-beta repeat-containing protein [Azospirillum oryzae]